ncbi:MAG: hypothetical protein ACFFG0_02415 [Candidatus Thorarchaeota archaeon]
MANKIKTGTYFKISKQVEKELSARFKEADNIEFSCMSILENLAVLRRDTWKFLEETYPELKDYSKSFDDQTGKLLIKGNKNGI